MKEKSMAKAKKRARSTLKLSTLDDFLAEEGRREEFEAEGFESADARARKDQVIVLLKSATGRL